MHRDTPRRLRYASGYRTLGLSKEAAGELEAIDLADRSNPEVLSAWIDLHLDAKQWETVVTVGRLLAETAPTVERGWFAWAYALRELERVKEAKHVLQRAIFKHDHRTGILYYNLGCYHALLGHVAETQDCLREAFKKEPSLRADAVKDPDLKEFWGDVPGL